LDGGGVLAFHSGAFLGGGVCHINIYILVYQYTEIVIFMSETTTVRVSKTTLEMLERLRNKMNTKTLDEAIRLFIARGRMMKVDEAFGLDKGRVKPFSEEDRGEDRN
jgi:hypothetical protein